MSEYVLRSAIPVAVTAPTIVEFSPDGRFICVGGDSRKLSIVDWTKIIPPSSYELPNNPTTVYWNEEFVLVGLQDGVIVIFFYYHGFDEFIDGPLPLRAKRALTGRPIGSPILSASYDPASYTLAFSTPHAISFFDFHPSERRTRFLRLIRFDYGPDHAGGAIVSVAFTPSGSLLVSHSIDGILLIESRGEPPSWSSQIHVETPANSLVRLMCFARDGQIRDAHHFWVTSLTPTPGLLVENGSTIIHDTGLGSLSLTNAMTGKLDMYLHSGDFGRIAFGYFENAYEKLVVTIQDTDRPVIKVWRATKPLSSNLLRVAADILTVRNFVACFVITLLLYATGYGLYRILVGFCEMLHFRLFPLLGDAAQTAAEQLLPRAVVSPAVLVARVRGGVANMRDIFAGVAAWRGVEGMAAFAN